MQGEEGEYYRCNTCGDVLTDETAIFDVEGEDTPYCAQCFYVFPHGPFYGPYDTGYREHHPTPKQQICLDCKVCCKGCYYLDAIKGCTIYPYRPLYCRGYKCAKLRGEAQ